MASWAGLPADLAPPDVVALRIANLPTMLERLALFNQIPAGYQHWVAHHAHMEIALKIVELPELERRREAMLEVPPAWHDKVAAFVRTFWKTRTIRAEYREEQARKRVRSRD